MITGHFTCNAFWTLKTNSSLSSEFFSGVFRPMEEQWELPDLLFDLLETRWSMNGTFLPLRRTIASLIVEIFIEIYSKLFKFFNFTVYLKSKYFFLIKNSLFYIKYSGTPCGWHWHLGLPGWRWWPHGSLPQSDWTHEAYLWSRISSPQVGRASAGAFEET